MTAIRKAWADMGASPQDDFARAVLAGADSFVLSPANIHQLQRLKTEVPILSQSYLFELPMWHAHATGRPDAGRPGDRGVESHGHHLAALDQATGDVPNAFILKYFLERSSPPSGCKTMTKIQVGSGEQEAFLRQTQGISNAVVKKVSPSKLRPLTP